MSIDAGRRDALRAAKLRALARTRWDVDDAEAGRFPDGATLTRGAAGWVYVEGDAHRVLGKALAWADRASLVDVHVLVDDERAAPGLARRAQAFERPATAVWRVDGHALTAAVPEPLAGPGALDPRAAMWADLIRAAGAEPVVEGDVLTGQVLGLEVARVVVDAEGAWLEVGVGKHDRHAQRLLWGDLPTIEALTRAVATVRAHRHARASHHPLNQLARERWLRAVVCDEPSLVGARRLLPTPGLAAPADLRDASPAPALGEDVDGRDVLVVCSVGIDLDLVPAAADLRLAAPRHPRLVLAVPERDDHPLLRRLASALREPAAVVTVPDDWVLRSRPETEPEPEP